MRICYRVVKEVAPKVRDIALVFMSYALYRQMSVYDIMAFGLKLRKVPKYEIEKRLKAASDTLGLLPYLFAPECRDQHDRGPMLRRLVALDVPAGLEAVHAGHPPVHEDDVIRVGGVVFLHRRNRLFPGSDGIDAAGDGA